MDGKNIDKNTRVVDTLALRRTAKEAKRYVVLMRLLKILAIILIAIVAAAYAVSYFYDKYGSFTVKISKYDMINQGLTLSETPDYTTSNSRLNADILYDMTNISGEDLPDNIDKINGSHNGEGYIAYTFYIENEGEEAINYWYSIIIDDVIKNVDEAARVMVYLNGDRRVYAKVNSYTNEPEKDTLPFYSKDEAVLEQRKDFKPGDIDKFTIVIWLEGDDPDCIDNILGGEIKMHMEIREEHKEESKNNEKE